MHVFLANVRTLAAPRQQAAQIPLLLPLIERHQAGTGHQFANVTGSDCSVGAHEVLRDSFRSSVLGFVVLRVQFVVNAGRVFFTLPVVRDLRASIRQHFLRTVHPTNGGDHFVAPEHFFVPTGIMKNGYWEGTK